MIVSVGLITRLALMKFCLSLKLEQKMLLNFH
jgi:hypothetical protein